MGPPVGYWVSTMISAVLDGLKYKTVEEDDEDTLGASSTRWRLTVFFDSEVIATDISNTFSNILFYWRV